jgi:hypothetical protein
MEHDNPEKQSVKIRIPLEEKDRSETLWGIAIQPSRFEIDNIPFYAYGVSLGDVVEARLDGDGVLVFSKIIKKAGNRTIRIFFKKGSGTPVAKRLLQAVVRLGCSFEGAKKRSVSICIPASVSLDEVEHFLDGVAELEWENGDK